MTSAHSRRGLQQLVGTALALAAGELVAARLVPATQLHLIGPVMLLGAVLCLSLVHRQLRHTPCRGRGASTVGRPARTGQAVGGPCDGQQLTLIAGVPVPAEFWLAAHGAPKHDPLHRYLLERPPADPPRYLHAPPPE